MKKQKKSKVEVVEPVSVANRCDYQRTNGKCGRALCDNFGKPCTGRACEDWKCDAEGEEEVKVKGEGEADGDEATNCEFNRAPYGYCMNRKSKHYSNSCHKCKAFKEKCDADAEGAVATQAVAVVATSQTSQTFQTSQTSYRDRVSGQYAAIGTAKDSLMRECVKFGALLTEVSYYLGETQGRKGAGLQAWLEENCPEINYSTAMNYKSAAAKFVKMIGGGSQAVAVLQDKTEVIPPGEDAPIEVDAKFIEKRDQLFNDVKSRRELEQTYFKFMAHEGKGRQGGANKGQSGTGRRALTAEEKSDAADVEIRELVGKIGAFDKSGKFRMLTAQTQSDIVLYLKDCVRSFEEQQA